MHLFLFIVLSVSLVGCGKGFKKDDTLPEATQVPSTPDQYTINQDYLVKLNQYRVSKKLRPLTYSSIIEDEAAKHSRSMAMHTTTFGHIGFNRRCSRIKTRLGPVHQCGEVVAMGQKTASLAMKSWLSSDIHRQELENPDYTHTAIATYKSLSGTSYWTQIFIEK